jgi:hypothetical protein
MFGEAASIGFKFRGLLHNHTVEYQLDLAIRNEGKMCHFSIFLGGFGTLEIFLIL